MQRELQFMGYTIVQTQYNNLFENKDNYGFECNHVYIVLDDFGDPALPIPNQSHWSVPDAMNAIAMFELLKARVREPNHVTYQYQVMTRYRRAFSTVYATLMDIEKDCVEAQDFDENATPAILEKLKRLKSIMMEGKTEDLNASRFQTP